MLSAQPAKAVAPSPNSAPRRVAQRAESFMAALSAGLIDVAFAFDGAFRPPGSMSLADRVAYGLRSLAHTVTCRTPSTPIHVAPGICRDREVVRRASRVLDDSPRLIASGRSAIAATPPATIEEVRREARLRHASSSDAPIRARPNKEGALPVVRVAATVGTAKLDVIVAGGGRFVSVMQWTR